MVSKDQQGIIHPYIIVIFVGIIIFFLLASFIPFRDKLFSMLYPKPTSKAQNIDELRILTNELLSTFKEYRKASPDKKNELLNSLITIARDRKAEMLQAAKLNTKSFTSNTLPRNITKKMPKILDEYFERETQVTGDLEAYHVHTSDNKAHTEYKLNNYSVYFIQDPPLSNNKKTTLQGFVLESIIVSPGSPGNSTVTSSPKLKPSNVRGTRKLAAMLINFQDNTSRNDVNNIPITVKRIQDLLDPSVPNSLGVYYEENSYLNVQFNVQVFDWQTIQATSSTCSSVDYTNWANLANKANNVAFNEYDHIVYIFPQVKSCVGANNNIRVGWAQLNGKPSWINGRIVTGNIVHEVGHNLGLHHAGMLNCSPDPQDACYEYNDLSDIMGNNVWGSPLFPHFNAPHKAQLNWLQNNQIQTVRANGTFDIIPLETSGFGNMALRIKKNDAADDYYYISYRQPVGFDQVLNNNISLGNNNIITTYGGFIDGVSIHIHNERTVVPTKIITYPDPANTTFNKNIYFSLKDAKSFTDQANGLRITQLSHNPSKATVRVEFGNQFCFQQQPLLTITPLVPDAPAGSSIDYDVSLTNNDSSVCPPTTFNVNAFVPTGWKGIFAQPSVTLVPGETVPQIFTVTSDPAAQDGIYNITVEANDAIDPIHGTTLVTQFVVFTTTPPPPTPTPSPTIVPAPPPIPGTFQRLDGVRLEHYLSRPDSMFVDRQRGYGYIASQYGSAQIARFNLATNQRAGSLFLNPGENTVSSGVVDEARGLAYLAVEGTGISKVVKIDLNNFSRVSEVSLSQGQYDFDSGVIDTANNAAYFGGCKSNIGVIVKINLSNFSREGEIPLNFDERCISSSVIDTANGYAYFGVWSTISGGPGRIIKIRLSDFSRVGELTLGQTPYLQTGVIDPQSGYSYWGVYDGIIFKVNLSSFTLESSITVSDSLAGYSTSLATSQIDHQGGFAYFGTDEVAGQVYKIRLSDFTEVAVINLNPEVYFLRDSIIDTQRGYVYFARDDAHTFVSRVKLSSFSRDGGIDFYGDNNIQTGVIDPTTGFGYYAAEGYPSKIIKMRLSDLKKVGELNTPDASTYLASNIDPGTGYAYFATTVNREMLKVRLSDFTIEKILPIGGYVRTSLIDLKNGFLYLITSGSLMKVRLSDFTLAATLPFIAGEQSPSSGVIDSDGKFLYYASYGSPITAPGTVVKIDLTTFSRVGAITLDPGENYLTSASIDPQNQYAYFGTYSYPGKIIKINLSTFTKDSALTLPTGEDSLTTSIIDQRGQYAYFGSYSAPSKIIQIDLATFTRNQVITLNSDEEALYTASLDPATNIIYFGTDSFPAHIIKVSIP